MRALLALLATLLLLLGAASSVAGDRGDAFPGYKEEEAPACTDQLGAAICEDYKLTQGCSRGALWAVLGLLFNSNHVGEQLLGCATWGACRPPCAGCAWGPAAGAVLQATACIPNCCRVCEEGVPENVRHMLRQLTAAALSG